VFKFSGVGAVTKMFVTPSYNAAAIIKPIAADFPLPLAAVIDTVYLKVSYVRASINIIRALA